MTSSRSTRSVGPNLSPNDAWSNAVIRSAQQERIEESGTPPVTRLRLGAYDAGGAIWRSSRSDQDPIAAPKANAFIERQIGPGVDSAWT